MFVICFCVSKYRMTNFASDSFFASDSITSNASVWTLVIFNAAMWWNVMKVNPDAKQKQVDQETYS